MKLGRWLGLALAGLVSIGGPAAAQDCPSSRVPVLVLPRLKEAMQKNQEIVIVALGSSSTAGWHSSDIAHSYPAVLQNLLTRAMPAAHVAVLNRGVGGQDAAEMLARLEVDVLRLNPMVVIWQVGANGAMRRVAPDQFRDMVQTGVRRLQDANIDVVLMDNQRAPAIMASPDHVRIDQALADVAATSGAGLFGRGALMEQWRHLGFPYEWFVSDDGIHHNDRGYACVARALGKAIMDGLVPEERDRALATRR